MNQNSPSATSELQKAMLTLYTDWVRTIQTRQWAWFERHFAEDMRVTASPFPEFAMGKRDFIEADKKIERLDATILNVIANPVREIVVTQMVLKVNAEELSTDLPGVSAAGLDKLTRGNITVYAGAWRRRGDIWECFSHHLVTAVAD
jgi:hypothetical protein